MRQVHPDRGTTAGPLLALAALAAIFLSACGSSSADDLDLEGQKEAAAGRYAEAIEKFDKALAKEPSYALALTHRGEARLALGDLTKADEDYEALKAIDAAAADSFGSEVAGAYIAEGSRRYVARDYKVAIRSFDRAITVDPSQTARTTEQLALSLNALGTERLGAREFEEAITAFERSLTLDPSLLESSRTPLAQAFNSRGLANSRIEDFNRAIELAPDYADAFKNRGLLLAKFPDRAEPALVDLNTATALHPPFRAELTEPIASLLQASCANRLAIAPGRPTAAALVSPVGGCFWIPVPTLTTWSWDLSATRDNVQEYLFEASFTVRGSTYGVGLSRFKLPGAAPRQGPFEQFIRESRTNLVRRMGTATSLVSSARDVVASVSLENGVLITLRDLEILAGLHEGRPRTATIMTAFQGNRGSSTTVIVYQD